MVKRIYQVAWKRVHERFDKASDENINKIYIKYKQRELIKKGDKTGKALGKHVISLYSSSISQVIKIMDAKKI